MDDPSAIQSMTSTSSTRPLGNRNLRKGRDSAPGLIYLITTVTHLRTPLFNDFWLGREPVIAMRRESSRADTLAFVVMPDHLHWLMRLRGEATLQQVVRNVKAFSARGVNIQRKQSAKVWQAGFHDHALRRDEALERVARYLVANPLRAGLVKRLSDYPLWDAVWLR